MYQAILKFWFEEVEQSQWWTKNAALDQMITEKFGELQQQATKCELYSWRESAKGRLAEIIVLDQFSRNIHRDSGFAFANDALALALAQEAVLQKADDALSPLENSFLYMPYMHSESLAIHHVATELYKKNGIESNYNFELKHKSIIEKYGRYPHRNSLLGRTSTLEELTFLNQPGSSF